MGSSNSLSIIPFTFKANRKLLTLSGIEAIEAIEAIYVIILFCYKNCGIFQ